MNLDNLKYHYERFLEKFGYWLSVHAFKKLVIVVVLITLWTCWAFGEEIKVDDVVWAIGKAENSERYPYGIKSIDTNGDKEYARKICKNSVINNYKRWLKAGKPKPFLEFMRDRFAPLEDSELNKYWVKNVTYYLRLTKRGE